MSAAHNEFKVHLTDSNPETVLTVVDHLGWATYVVATMEELGCVRGIPGGQCRIYASAELDPDQSDTLEITVECPRSSAKCQQTCDGFVTFLASSYLGSLRNPGVLSRSKD